MLSASQECCVVHWLKRPVTASVIYGKVAVVDTLQHVKTGVLSLKCGLVGLCRRIANSQAQSE